MFSSNHKTCHRLPLGANILIGTGQISFTSVFPHNNYCKSTDLCSAFESVRSTIAPLLRCKAVRMLKKPPYRQYVRGSAGIPTHIRNFGTRWICRATKRDQTEMSDFCTTNRLQDTNFYFGNLPSGQSMLMLTTWANYISLSCVLKRIISEYTTIV